MIGDIREKLINVLSTVNMSPVCSFGANPNNRVFYSKAIKDTDYPYLIIMAEPERITHDSINEFINQTIRFHLITHNKKDLNIETVVNDICDEIESETMFNDDMTDCKMLMIKRISIDDQRDINGIVETRIKYSFDFMIK